MAGKTPTMCVVTIDGLDEQGLGTVTLDGDELHQVAPKMTSPLELHVSGAAPADRVRVRVEHISRQHHRAWASVVQVIERGAHFAVPACPHAVQAGGRCGGCPLMHLTEDAQQAHGATRVREALATISWADPVVLRTVAPRSGYRARTHFVVQRQHGGRVRLGVYEPRSHELVEVPGCLVLRPPLGQLAEPLAILFGEEAVPVYPEPHGLRYVTMRADQGGQVLIELVIGSQAPAWLDRVASRLVEVPSVVGVAWSSNLSPGNAIRGGPSLHVMGRGWVEEVFGPTAVAADAGSFTQLHSGVAEAMYLRAAEWLGPVGRLWDLYCGIGGFGKTVAKLVEARQGAPVELFGAESHGRACELAARGASAQSRFDVVDLRSTTPGWPLPDAVLVNPPRRGLDPPVLERLAELRAPVVYMSCGPKSFARDVGWLEERGLHLTQLEAYDMLPQTTHVELLGAIRAKE